MARESTKNRLSPGIAAAGAPVAVPALERLARALGHQAAREQLSPHLPNSTEDMPETSSRFPQKYPLQTIER
jgi:hypothetical protein